MAPRVRCVWLDTPLAQAQVNLVRRQLELFGRLPGPEELRVLAKRHPGLMAPTSQLRAVRELEAPDGRRGVRRRWSVCRSVVRLRPGVPGVFVASDAVPGFRIEDPSVPHLVFGWQVPDDVELPGAVVASCPHPGGPPICWCRPPLPGTGARFLPRPGRRPRALGARGNDRHAQRPGDRGRRPVHRPRRSRRGSRPIGSSSPMSASADGCRGAPDTCR